MPQNDSAYYCRQWVNRRTRRACLKGQRRRWAEYYTDSWQRFERRLSKEMVVTRVGED